MAKTHAVILDLDGTLFDHAASAGAGLRAVMDRFDILENAADVATRYEQLRAQTVTAVLNGELDADEAREQRFSILLEELGVPDAAILGRSGAKTYLKGYKAGGSLMPGAKETLKALRDKGLKLAIMSDFARESQQAKVAAHGLDRLVDTVIYLEDVPAARPDPAAFHAACGALGAETKATTMVGDSIQLDITGALDAGLRVIWFSPGRPDLAPAREITTVNALGQILEHV